MKFRNTMLLSNLFRLLGVLAVLSPVLLAPELPGSMLLGHEVLHVVGFCTASPTSTYLSVDTHMNTHTCVYVGFLRCAAVQPRLGACDCLC